MSDWDPIRKHVADYNKAPCKVMPILDDKGKVNHWLLGYGHKTRGEDRNDPDFLKSLRDEHAMWKKSKADFSQTGLAKTYGVTTSFINKIINGLAFPTYIDTHRIIKQYHYWLGIDAKHSPKAVCKRENVGKSWYFEHVANIVEGKNASA